MKTFQGPAVERRQKRRRGCLQIAFWYQNTGVEFVGGFSE